MPGERQTRVPLPETERLALRPLSGPDAEALHRISNEPPVRRYLRDDEPVSRSRIEELIVQSARTFSESGLGLFGVHLRGSEEIVGLCGFFRSGGMEEMELAYELTHDLWRRRLAAEVARACLAYAFTEAGLERVTVGADRTNVASVRVIEKLGMRDIGGANPRAPEVPYYTLDLKDFFAAREKGSG
jgi:ribosomal-protein-alanine N-acetyltransferase